MLIRLFQLILLIDLVINLSFASNEADLKESSTNKGLSLIKEEISVPKCELELYGIALFNNSSPLYELYALANWSQWALIGLIYRDTSYSDKNDKNGWYVLESNLHKNCWGVQIHSWRKMYDLIGNNDADIAIREFQYSEKNKKPNSEILKKNLANYLGLPFKKNPLVGTLAIFHANFFEDKGTYFCSELTAVILQDLEILLKDHFADNYVPADFSDERPQGIVKFKDGFSLSRQTIFQKRTPYKSFGNRISRIFWSLLNFNKT